MSGEVLALDRKAILSGLRRSERMRRRADEERLRWLRAAQACEGLTMEEAAQAAGIKRIRAHEILRNARA